jgi:hypothetical protein
MAPALRLLESWRVSCGLARSGQYRERDGGPKTDASKFLGPEPAPIHAENLD